MHETAKLGVGVSYYQGGFRSDTTVSYEMKDGGFESKTQTDAVQQILERTYVGADAQFSISTAAGYTTVRAEYIQGTQPSQSVASNPQATLTYPVLAADAKKSYYLRNFNGAYFYLVQSIMPSKHAVVVKYDWFDRTPMLKAMHSILPKNLLQAILHSTP